MSDVVRFRSRREIDEDVAASALVDAQEEAERLLGEARADLLGGDLDVPQVSGAAIVLSHVDGTFSVYLPSGQIQDGAALLAGLAHAQYQLHRAALEGCIAVE